MTARETRNNEWNVRWTRSCCTPRSHGARSPRNTRIWTTRSSARLWARYGKFFPRTNADLSFSKQSVFALSTSSNTLATSTPLDEPRTKRRTAWGKRLSAKTWNPRNSWTFYKPNAIHRCSKIRRITQMLCQREVARWVARTNCNRWIPLCITKTLWCAFWIPRPPQRARLRQWETPWRKKWKRSAAGNNATCPTQDPGIPVALI